MDQFAEDISRLLVRELQAFQRELELFPDDESVWRTVPGITNSAGNLALHVSGKAVMRTKLRTGLFLAHLAAHTAFHLGQAGYLRRALTGDGRTSGALPLQSLAE